MNFLEFVTAIGGNPENMRDYAESAFDELYKHRLAKHQYFDHVEFQEDNIHVYAETKACGCCPGDVEYFCSMDYDEVFAQYDIVERVAAPKSHVTRMTREEVKSLYELSQQDNVEMLHIESSETGIGQGHKVQCMEFRDNGWTAVGEVRDITDYGNW